MGFGVSNLTFNPLSHVRDAVFGIEVFGAGIIVPLTFLSFSLLGQRLVWILTSFVVVWVI